MDLLKRTLILFVVTCIALTIQNSQKQQKRITKENLMLNTDKNSINRIPRTIFKTKTKRGPVRQVFGIFLDQWNDTRNTFNTIYQTVNENFLPENVTTTTPNPTPNPSDPTTKAPPYRITRSELYRILRRNLNGLVRLYNLELSDALKQSKVTQRDYNRNVSREISKYL